MQTNETETERCAKCGTDDVDLTPVDNPINKATDLICEPCREELFDDDDRQAHEASLSATVLG